MIFSISLMLTYGQSIPNGGFESWQISNFENPLFWGCSNYEKNEAITPVTAVKTSDAFHGQYAIKLTTSAVSTGTKLAFGWIADGMPDPVYSQGGIPYNQKPTGIRFRFKTNIVAGDTAFVFCMFKKAGVQIGFYYYKFATTQANYTLFNTNFTPALSQTPDTIAFACASSHVFNQSLNKVGNSIQLDSITFKGVTAQPTNFNGDFENWYSETNDKLNGWFTDMSFSRTTDVYSGNYALELQSVGPSLTKNQAQAGRANTNPCGGGCNLGGYPYNLQNDTISFYYKYIPAHPQDSGRVFVNFKKNGVNVGTLYKLLGISATYKQVKMGYDPTKVTQVPDSVNITFESSKWPMQNTYVGSDLKIDNLYFFSQKIPISNFNLPAVGCKGQPIQLTDVSANMPNAWAWIMPGGIPGSSTMQSPIVVYNTVGTKTITMVANNQFGAGAVISKTIMVNSIPSVSSTSVTTPCGGGNAVLTASGANTYTWSTGANTSTIAVSPTVTTGYTVVGTTNGCSNGAIGAVIVPGVPRPDICIVTVDSANQYNEIYWDKTAYPMLDSMIVYREVISNTFKRIGAVGKSAISRFVDTARSIGPANGDPNISTYRYKLQMRDTCGNYGPKSLWHNTIFFTHTGSTFFWTNNYMIEGPYNPVQTYSLMVCPNPTANATYSLVGTTTGNQSTLNDPFYNVYSATADWRVVADLGYTCTPSFMYVKSGINTQGANAPISKSSSNIQNNRPSIGMKEYNLKAVTRVYPNPTSGKLNIEFEKINGEVNIVMTDILGREVYNEKTLANRIIDVSGFSKGVYVLSLNTQNGKALYKVIVE